MTSIPVLSGRRSVRRTVIVSAVAVVALAVFLVSWRDYQFTTRLLADQASRGMSASVAGAAARLDALVATRLDAVRTAAQNPLLVDYANGDRTARNGALQALYALVRLDPIHNTEVGIIDNQRRVILATADTVDPGSPGTIADLPYPIALNFLSGAGNAANTAFVASVRNRKAEQRAVLGLRTRPTVYTQVLGEEARGTAAQGLMRVRETSGAVVAAWPLPQKGKVPPAAQPWDSLPPNVSLLSETILPGGIRERRFRMVTHGNIVREASLRLKTVPWYVAMTVDEADVLAPARLEATNTLKYAGGVLLGVALLSALIGRRFAARIEETAVVVRRIAGGDRTARVVIDRTNDEITQLGRDVNRMTDELAGTLSSLEERTQQLEAELEERAILEARLVESRRMEAIGMVAGTVAHDFNNMLTIVLSAAESARAALPDRCEAAPDIDEIVMAAERGADLTRRLMGIARQSDARPARLDAAVLLRDNSRLLRRLVRDGSIDVVTMDSRAWVFIDAADLLQSLLNLVANARDASGDAPPRVSIRVERVLQPPGGLLGGAVLDDGEYVTIAVQDYGSGMDPKTVNRLCEPFFTTKPRGKGTGLGLASVSKSMREVGGALAVRSARGEGSTFTLVLPFAGTSPNAVNANADWSTSAPSGS
ncbi:sensor histidine kinase [Gemmatimonas phototrophica]|uniref:sensor histidine kinase n=1 Tax=Gemmatimonas phototrophica TaxID=1379270 RepID=UPI0004796A76|nr:ATP-binding protein [Gemmatimonas phototrophica]